MVLWTKAQNPIKCHHDPRATPTFIRSFVHLGRGIPSQTVFQLILLSLVEQFTWYRIEFSKCFFSIVSCPSVKENVYLFLIKIKLQKNYWIVTSTLAHLSWSCIAAKWRAVRPCSPPWSTLNWLLNLANDCNTVTCRTFSFTIYLHANETLLSQIFYSILVIINVRIYQNRTFFKIGSNFLHISNSRVYIDGYYTNNDNAFALFIWYLVKLCS